MKRFLTIAMAALVLALPLAGCTMGGKVGVGAGWRSTPEMTGPVVEAVVPEVKIENPLSGVFTDSAPTVTTPDPAVTEGIKSLEAKAAASAEKVAALDASAKAALEASTAAAREAAKSAQAAEAKAQSAEASAKDSTPGLPRDLSLGGILTALLGAGTWLAKRSAAKHAREVANAAVAASKAATADAIAKYDALPETATDAEVKAVVQ